MRSENYTMHYSGAAVRNVTRRIIEPLELGLHDAMQMSVTVFDLHGTDYRLITSGDVHLNPGPVASPCQVCSKSVRRNQRGKLCDGCDLWHHAKCVDMTVAEYPYLSNSTDYWHFHKCTLPQVHSATSALCHKCTLLQVHTATSALCHKCTLPQVHTATSALCHKCILPQVHSSTSAHCHKCTLPQVHSATSAHCHKCTLPQFTNSFFHSTTSTLAFDRLTQSRRLDSSGNSNSTRYSDSWS